jgi:hypothetical protein
MEPGRRPSRSSGWRGGGDVLDAAREQGLVSLQDELLVSRSPLIVARPERKGLRFAVGIEITPESCPCFWG